MTSIIFVIKTHDKLQSSALYKKSSLFSSLMDVKVVPKLIMWVMAFGPSDLANIRNINLSQLGWLCQ